MKGIRKNKDYCDVCGKICKSINGQKRKEALFDKGINYMKVQHLVNVLYSM